MDRLLKYDQDEENKMTMMKSKTTEQQKESIKYMEIKKKV